MYNVYLLLYNVLKKLMVWIEPKISSPKVNKLTVSEVPEETQDELRRKLQQEQLDLANQMHRGFIQRLLNDPARLRRLLTRKDPELCNHLKGGDVGTQFKDYAVTTHTLPDGETYIRCMICADRWVPSDPDWNAAVIMTHNSSNSPSSSEVVYMKQPNSETITVAVRRL
jgi:hypothetical protein